MLAGVVTPYLTLLILALYFSLHIITVVLAKVRANCAVLPSRCPLVTVSSLVHHTHLQVRRQQRYQYLRFDWNSFRPAIALSMRQSWAWQGDSQHWMGRWSPLWCGPA